jgi:hypothetical protein
VVKLFFAPIVRAFLALHASPKSRWPEDNKIRWGPDRSIRAEPRASLMVCA